MASNKNTDLIEMLDKKLDKLDSRLDKISEKTETIDKTLEKQNLQLTYHIKRTDILEKRLAILDKHKTKIELVIRLIGWGVTGAIAIIGVIESVTKIISYLK